MNIIPSINIKGLPNYSTYLADCNYIKPYLSNISL